MEFEGLPWDFERKWDLGRPKTGLALHHLVTAFSVKKPLLDRGRIVAFRLPPATQWRGSDESS
jgi:hypothetical protein